MKKLMLLGIILIFAQIIYAQDSIPIPHGIDGYILKLSDSSQADAGTFFSINDTNSGFFRTGQTGIGPFTGKYSVAVTGADGDTIIIKAWNSQGSSSRIITLSGAMHDINLFLNMQSDPTNQVPFFTTTPSLIGSTGVQYIYESRATDPEGNAITYAIVSGPTPITIDATGKVLWTPIQTGQTSITISASDGVNIVTQTFEVIVAGGSNSIPSIISQAITIATVGTQYQYQITATDGDNDPLAYQFLESPSGMEISSTGLITWTPQSAGQNSVNANHSNRKSPIFRGDWF